MLGVVIGGFILMFLFEIIGGFLEPIFEMVDELNNELKPDI